MVISNFSRRDTGTPIMLWIKRDFSEQDIGLDVLQQDCEVLVANSIEEGVDTLVHQPVDILVLDLSVLSSADPALVVEIRRCWPYLLCLVLSEDYQSEDCYQQPVQSINALCLPQDPEDLKQQLLMGIGQSDGKNLLH